MLPDTLLNPFFDAADSCFVLSPFRPLTDDILETSPWNNQIPAGSIKVQIRFITQQQAIIFIENGKTFRNAADGFP
jgi:hypothetical protein